MKIPTVSQLFRGLSEETMGRDKSCFPLDEVDPEGVIPGTYPKCCEIFIVLVPVPSGNQTWQWKILRSWRL